MNTWMNRLGRRWIAGLLAIAMLSGTIPAALAAEEDPKHTTESTSQEGLLLEETQTVPATDPSAPETEQTVPETETTAVKETTQEELLLEEEEEEENLLLDMAMMPMLLMEEGDPVALSDDEFLTLDEVNRLSEICKTSVSLTNLPFSATKDDDGQVTSAAVQGAAGLILLSNLNPSLYSDAEISLTLNDNDKYDLVTPLTFKETATDGTVKDYTYEFKGLGGTNAAFAGKIKVTDDTVRVFYTSRSLFNNLDTSAQLLDKNNQSLALSLGYKLNDNQIDLSTPVLAGKVQGTGEANWSLKLLQNAAIGGIIGTMDSGTVNLSVQVAGGVSMAVQSANHAGFFCNQMNGGTLTATLDGSGSVSVTAGSGSAGGYVGYMAKGASLTANLAEGASVSVTGVTAQTGSAGGIVGSVGGSDAESNAVINVNAVPTTSVTAKNGSAGGYVGEILADTAIYAAADLAAGTTISATTNVGGLVGEAVNTVITPLSTIVVSNVTLSRYSNGVLTSAGGLIGDYTVTKNGSVDLSQFTIDVTLPSGSCTNAGGVFGALTNNTGADDAASAYTIRNGSITVTAANGSNVTNFGGLIGSYSANAMGNTLKTTDVTVTSTNNGSAASYGGVIGSVGNNSYVEIEDQGTMTVTTAGGAGTNFGGLVGVLGASSNVGAFLNIGNVTLVRTGDAPSAGTAVGGLVGALNAGVVRLHGTTNLSGMAFTKAGGGTGQIVGRNTNGLVYAVGTGNAIDTNSDWLLERPTGGKASDIGNWGQVVRLDGTKLTENSATNTAPATDLFKFDETNHTVTVLGNLTSTCTISSVRDFAAYALHYDFGSADQAALIFEGSGVEPSTAHTIVSQNVTISGEINLTGTGILGIGRDNGTGADGKSNADSNYFVGTISGAEGTNPRITLDIGSSAYGDGVTEEASLIGNGGLQLFSDGHHFLGLLPVAGGNTTKISNLTIAGTVKGNSGDSSQKRAAGAIGYCRADNITFDNVTVSAEVNVSGESGTIYQGGFFGDLVNGTQTAAFRNCIWSGMLENKVSGSKIGGFAAYIKNGHKTIIVNDCALSGTIDTTAGGDAHVGGLFAEIEYDGSANASTVSISNLTVSGTITAAKASTSCGGFLGYSWLNTNVTFGNGTSGGVTISGATLNAGNAKFGGLVYQATGYWNATADNSIKFTSRKAESSTETIKTQISGGTTTTDPSGLLVGTGIYRYNTTHYNNLYLEVGTFGSEGAAYYYDKSAASLALSGDTSSFDELVGKTIVGNFGHDNAVVSLATAGDVIDTDINNDQIDDCTTYTSQTGINYQNPKTRYYYNLHSFRAAGADGKSTLSANSLTDAGKVVSWSVSQYAAENIRGYFCANSDAAAAISGGNIDLTHYSYYPITAYSSVTVSCSGLKFGYETIETAETGNKQPSEQNQHHLMHYGLLYELGGNLSVSGTTLSGTVGKRSDKSGALILNTISGNAKQTPVASRTIELRNVTLAGLRVSGVSDDSKVYPLLINKIGEAVTLTVDGLWTGSGYLDANNNTLTAATSLIGEVGFDEATDLKLIFSNIALDARKSAWDSTSVTNNKGNVGAKPVEYHTYKSIFTRATLLESFKYTTSSSGYYNFNSYDSKVTYGVEISNTTSGRNQEEQYEYFDNTDKTWDGLVTEKTNGGYYDFTSGYLRYVCQPEKDNTHELDINRKPKNLDDGCGTYGDPYIITNGKQLVALAKYLQGQGAEGFKVTFDTRVLGEQKADNKDYYHIANSTENNGHATYTWSSSKWSDNASKDNIDNYLRNAYYQIGDVLISDSDWAGLGTADEPFSGVIVGKAANTTVTIKVKNQSVANFGGLIKYSRGSVVKNLKVAYDSAANIQINNTAVPGSGTNNPFFGGVVGYCMGGDTIIDNVSVTYEGTIALSGSNARLIAAGGYVGLVGGARDGNYEKTGGGVVFRNMGSHTNNFADQQTNAKAETTYFYCNPYVGRVLDGYACYEGGTAGTSTLDNTDKNYSIPTLSGTTGLSVNDTNKTVTVSSAQGLWLLSAIVNSGAGAMKSDGSYTDQFIGTTDAYQSGKPRTCNYEGIGKDEGVSQIGDEAYWGGVSKNDTDRVSRLVKNYTNPDNGIYYAAQLTGANNRAYKLVFDASDNSTIDISGYGNGFRGIGGSFGQSLTTWEQSGTLKGRYLCVSEVSGQKPNTTIKLGIDRKDYITNYEKNAWFLQGAGLFTGFCFPVDCEVTNLTISGKVKLTHYKNTGEETAIQKNGGYSEVTSGGFAARTVNAKNKTATFDGFKLENLEVYGGIHAAGAIGLLERTGGEKKLTFSDWSIGRGQDAPDVTVSKNVGNDGCSGGLLGWVHYGTVTITGYGKGDEKWNVDGLNVSSEKTATKTSVTAGGLIGAADKTTVTISDVRAQNMTVKATKAVFVGGLIGGFKDGSTPTLTIKDCYLSGITVTATGSEYVGGVYGGCPDNRPVKSVNISGIELTGSTAVTGSQCDNVGGIVGACKQPSTITGITLSGTTTVNGSNVKAAGGIAGYLSSNHWVGDITLDETVKVTGTACTSVGGVIGETGGTSNIGIKNDNTTADPVNLTGATVEGTSCTNVGGVVGKTSGTTTIQNVSITAAEPSGSDQGTRTTVKGSSCTAVGGVVGQVSATTMITAPNIVSLKMPCVNTRSVGGVVGRATHDLTISNATITGSTEISESGHTDNDYEVGGVLGRANTSNNSPVTNISGCEIRGTDALPVKILNAAAIDKEKSISGGLIGYFNGDTATIENCTLKYVNILSGNGSGGLVGFNDKVKMKIRNTELLNCVVATACRRNDNTHYSNCRVGLITSSTWNNLFVYNVLAKDSIVGYYNGMQSGSTPDVSTLLSGMNEMDTTNMGLYLTTDKSAKLQLYQALNGTNYTYTNNCVGRWIGRRLCNDQEDRRLELVAISCDGCSLPPVDCALLTNGGTTYTNFVYADYPADQTNDTTSASPWLDVNPKVTIGNLTLTSNGVGSVTSGENELTGYGEIILNDAMNANANRKYRNVPTGLATDFAKLLDNTQDAYVSTYRTEESASTTVSDSVDFPILVLSAPDPDPWLWNYIAALTNVASGNIAKTQATTVVVTSYQWKDSQFKKASPSSLKVETDNTIKVVTGAYDNEASRFTLLDVQYADPTGSGNVFHLYVPVLVKKVLGVYASVNIKAGTNYLPRAYTNTSSYEAAGIHEPITAYISYKYTRDVNEWNAMLNDGASLLWSYNKTLDLHGESTTLPVGTRLTVVNTLNDQMATYTLTEDDVTAADGKSPAREFDLSAKMGLAAPMMSELLDINVAGWKDGDPNRYVKLDNEVGATVKVGNDYYRPATDNDTTGDFYRLTAGKDAEEAYFLTIQIPESVQQSEDKMYVNVLRINKTLTREGSGPPARIVETDPYYSYLLYDCMKQTSFSIKTTHQRGDSEVSDTEMINGDKILVALSTTMELTDKGKEKFNDNGPKEVYHQFLLELKEHKNGQVTGIPIGATHIKWTYTLTLVNDAGEVLKIDSFTQNDSPGVLETFPINASDYMDGDLPKAIKDQWVNARRTDNSYNRLKIEAQLLLSYGDNVGSVFPSRTLSNDKDGANYCAESRMAYVSSQLPIAAVQRAHDGKVAGSDSFTLYYCAQPTSTTLTFDALDFYGDGGKTLQLGINPDDPTGDRRIQTEAIYEYGGVSDLAEAKYIRYKLELFRKSESGSYTDDGALSDMREYLTELRTSEDVQFDYEKVEDSNEKKNTTYMIVDKELPSDFAAIEPKSQRICIDFSPCTGLEFEQKTNINPVYSNYMLRLTVSLLKENKEDVPGTAVSDWIIYTNARVKRELVDFPPSAGGA